MKTDYDYYLLGCRHTEVVPLSRWRFTVAYAKYRQMLKWDMDNWLNLVSGKRVRVVARWNRLRHLAVLVKRGKDLVFTATGGDLFFEDGGDAGTTGAGDREPRVPLTPLLAGGCAHSLPRRSDEYFIPRHL